MAQQAKVPVTKYNNMSFIPRTHMVEGETYSRKLPSDQSMYAVVCAHVIDKCKKN